MYVRFDLSNLQMFHAMEMANLAKQKDRNLLHMMMSSNENIFRVTGHLCGEFTGSRWIPRIKASDAELWCFLWSASQSTVE